MLEPPKWGSFSSSWNSTPCIFGSTQDWWLKPIFNPFSHPGILTTKSIIWWAKKAPTRFADGFPYYKVHRDAWPWYDPGEMLDTVEMGCPSAILEGRLNRLAWSWSRAFFVLKYGGGGTGASWKLSACALEVDKIEFKSQLQHFLSLIRSLQFP